MGTAVEGLLLCLADFEGEEEESDTRTVVTNEFSEDCEQSDAACARNYPHANR